MKEYPGGGATEHEQYFGMKLCSARMVIECAFGRLNIMNESTTPALLWPW